MEIHIKVLEIHTLTLMVDVRCVASRMRIGITTDSAVDLFQMPLGCKILVGSSALVYVWHLPIGATQPEDGWPLPFGDVSGFIL